MGDREPHHWRDEAGWGSPPERGASASLAASGLTVATSPPFFAPKRWGRRHKVGTSIDVPTFFSNAKRWGRRQKVGTS